MVLSTMKYQCSGDGPATHVDCGFATDSLRAANRHFELTGHSVDSAPGQVERDTHATCIDPDHGIGDHPCDEILGAQRAAELRDIEFAYGSEAIN